MKKAFLLTFMVIIGLGCAYAQKITLLSPNGGESLVSGTPLMITWNYSGLSGNETILIALEGATDYGPIAYSKLSQGSLEWLAGQKMDNSFAKPATDYKIILEVKDNDSIYDVSDEPFAITGPMAVIALMTPNGGETLEKGSDFNVNWSCAGKEGFVALTLVKDDQPLGMIAENLPATNLTYRWRIGSPLLNGVEYGIGGNYRIQIQWRLRQLLGRDKDAPERTGARIQATPGVVQKNIDRSDNVFSIQQAGSAAQKRNKDRIVE